MRNDQDEKIEADLTIEESGGFEQNEENAPLLENGWKDELNLAEFPIAALSDRVPDGQLTLVFEDKLERRDSDPIVRRLTIMGTPKHGLPTSMDDEVLVGLIQLTKRRSNFTDPRVTFSRYELIELLGWPQSGHSYRRIEEALHRWVGVVLMYENAWWDNNAKSWVDENFHVLDNVTLYDRERRKPGKPPKGMGKGAPPKRSRKVGAEGDPLPLSNFKWNEVIFQSFQSGNLKQLDLEFYLKLRLPTTKRMFRFLDKRFYRRTQLDFDLRTLACEHIGLSRSYAPTELKRRLKPALEELEQLGFLEPLDTEERYSWVARGSWRIILIRGASVQGEPMAGTEAGDLIESLKARGVTAKTASELVSTHAGSRVRTKLEVFDWMVKNQDKRVSKNAAGYLVASIRSDYKAPTDFTAAETRSKAAGKAVETAKDAVEADRRQKRKAKDEAERAKAREASLRERWERLDDADREAIIASVKAENPGIGRFKSMLEPLYLAALEKKFGTETPTGQKTLFPDV